MSVAASSTPDPGGNWPVYSTTTAGLILSPTHNRLLCSFPYDAGTTERSCDALGGTDECVPGCTPAWGGWGCHAGGCDGPAWCTPEQRGWPCAWPPEHLRESLQTRERIAEARGATDEYDVERDFVPDGQRFYNELILEFARFHQQLPVSIEAIFYVAHTSCDDTRPQPWVRGYQAPKCEEYARWVHGLLRERWPESYVPLVRLDPWRWEEPFSEG